MILYIIYANRNNKKKMPYNVLIYTRMYINNAALDM